jgi:hypothetical protein
VEDLYEDKAGDPDHPGKFVMVNDVDKDNDGIPDFADGFNAFGGSSSQTAGEQFTPLVFELPVPIDPAKAKVRLTYDASDPAGVTREGTAPDYTYTAAPGKLRIWTKPGDQPRNKAGVTNGGDYVAPGTLSPAALGLQGNGAVTLYVERIGPSSGPGDAQIKVEVDPDGDEGPAGFMLVDAVRLTVLRIDLDVDSDNNSALGAPDRSDLEDQYEDRENDPDHPGKFVMVNDDDTDKNGIPDFADGYGETFAQTVGDHFPPIELELPVPIDVSKARVKLTYDACDPSGVQRSGTAPDYVYTPAPGKLRIWAKQAGEARNKASIADGGDYVPSGEFLATTLGFQSNGTRTFYVEGITPSSGLGDAQIKVEVDPDGDGPAGWVGLDSVRLTLLRVRLTVYGGDGTTEVKPGKKNDPGAYLWYNRDDDDANDEEDREAQSTTPGEDDLVKMTTAFNSFFDTLQRGVVLLQRDNDRLELWKDPQKTGEPGESRLALVANVRSYDLGTVSGREAFHTEVLNKNLWLEGAAASAALQDAGIRLRYQHKPPQDVGEDYVAATVLNVEASHVAFNHDRTAHGADGVNIRRDGDANTEIEAPEWQVDGSDTGTDPDKCDPALYIGDKRVTVYVRFTCTPAISSASIRGVGTREQTGALSLGNLGAAADQAESWRDVAFASGVSNGVQIPANTGPNGFVAFTPQNKTGNKVLLEDARWQFMVKGINGDGAMPWIRINASGQKKAHRLYTVLDASSYAPWEFADNTNQPRKQPWAGALEKACGWAKETAAKSDCAGKVTQAIYDSGFQYDNVYGRWRFNVNDAFDLPSCLASWGQGTVNCWDCGAMVCVFGNILGCESRRWYITRSGGFLLNYIKAIGRGWTNNPFSQTPRVGFGHHWTAWSAVYDACLEVDDAAPPGSASPTSSTLPKNMDASAYLDRLVDPSNRAGTTGTEDDPPGIYTP